MEENKNSLLIEKLWYNEKGCLHGRSCIFGCVIETLDLLILMRPHLRYHFNTIGLFTIGLAYIVQYLSVQQKLQFSVDLLEMYIQY